MLWYYKESLIWKLIARTAVLHRSSFTLKEMSKSVRRLIDYFLVVTFEQQIDSNPSSDSTLSNIPEFQPIIAARYPLEDHVGTPLHESVTCFCHPQGNVRLRKVPPNLPKVIHSSLFVVPYLVFDWNTQAQQSFLFSVL